MNYKIVTTMGPKGWELYGQRMVNSYRKFWPAAKLDVWFHDTEQPAVAPEGVTFRSLDNLPGFMKQKLMWNNAKNGPGLNYSFKAQALLASADEDLDWIAFVDADTEMFREADDQLLAELFDDNADLTYLYRRTVQESEGSWFAFNLKSERGRSLLLDYWGLYDSGEVRHYKKAHDNAVLDRLVTVHVAHGLRVKNLSSGALGLDAFHQSPLGRVAVHYKGPNKDKVAAPDLMQPQRYHFVKELAVSACKGVAAPLIVEVGTHNGTRAVAIAEALFDAGHKEVRYLGFDTFQDGNDRVHESHSKEHAQEEHVAGRLANYGEVQARKGLAFGFKLVRGNTLETLAPAMAELGERPDFVYLDGGHSEETVRSDYEAVKHARYVVFDDVLDPEPGAPDGPYKVFNEAQAERTLIQTGDGYMGCAGKIKLGVVGSPPLDFKQPLYVKPQDSVDKSFLLEYINVNSVVLEKWVPIWQAHRGTALLVSAGPTLDDYLKEIKFRQKCGDTVFAVKHAVPKLLKAGVEPDYVVVLDPRPIDEPSTHGIQRRTLFEGLTKRSRVLLATMTNPAVTEYLMSRLGSNRIWGWHAFNQLVVDGKSEHFKRGLIVRGGTCAATRAPSLAHALGFRRMVFFGYDFYYPEDTDPKTLKQRLIDVEYLDKKYKSTGELIAALQDMRELTQWILEQRLTVTWRGDGLAARAFAQTNYVNPDEPPDRY